MSIFDILITISFLSVVFLFFFLNLLYKKLIVSLEEIKEIKQSNEKAFETIQELEEKIFEYRIITENIQENQNNLDKSFEKLESSFQVLKETATALQSAHQTKKAMLDIING